MIETSGHLPECVCPPGCAGTECPACICDRLRACEQRVNDEWVRDFGGHRAFALGVQAARDAVESLNNVTYQTALAAIDALRSEP